MPFDALGLPKALYMNMLDALSFNIVAGTLAHVVHCFFGLSRTNFKMQLGLGTVHDRPSSDGICMPFGSYKRGVSQAAAYVDHADSARKLYVAC